MFSLRSICFLLSIEFFSLSLSWFGIYIRWNLFILFVLFFHLLPSLSINANALTIISVIGFFVCWSCRKKQQRTRKAYKKRTSRTSMKQKVSRKSSTIGRRWNRPFCYLCSFRNIKCCLVLWFRMCVFFFSLSLAFLSFEGTSTLIPLTVRDAIATNQIDFWARLKKFNTWIRTQTTPNVAMIKNNVAHTHTHTNVHIQTDIRTLRTESYSNIHWRESQSMYVACIPFGEDTTVSVHTCMHISIYKNNTYL